MEFQLNKVVDPDTLLKITPGKFSLQHKIVDEGSIIEAKAQLFECYQDIITLFKVYLEMPEKYYKFISTWIIGTYFHSNFNSYPYLFFNAMRGSGKTRALKMISSLGSKGDGSVQNNLTEAVLFRIPKGTTTCIDEVEQIGSKEKQTLRELLNAAYKKGTKVKRMKKVRTKEGGEEQIADVFEPYFPIAMANIWGMDEVLGDRSITLVLEKSNNPGVTKKVEDFDTNPKILELKRTLRQISDVSAVTFLKKEYITEWNSYIDTKYNSINVTNVYNIINITNGTNNMKSQDLDLINFFNKIDDLGIAGRNFELLFPIFLVAKHIGEEVLEEIIKIGAELTIEKQKEEISESIDVSLFEFVNTLSSRGLEYIPMKEIVSKFRIFLGEEHDWLNEKWMGRALKRLNLTLDKRKVASGRMVILNYAKAKEKFAIFELKGEHHNE